MTNNLGTTYAIGDKVLLNSRRLALQMAPNTRHTVFEQRGKWEALFDTLLLSATTANLAGVRWCSGGRGQGRD